MNLGGGLLLVVAHNWTYCFLWISHHHHMQTIQTRESNFLPETLFWFEVFTGLGTQLYASKIIHILGRCQGSI